MHRAHRPAQPRPAGPLAAARRIAIAALAALLAACGGSDSATGPGGPITDETPRSEVPAELAGSWRYGRISPTNFWNDHTGQYAGNAYGFADYIDFEPNGTFTRMVYIYTNSYGCQTQVWTQMRGTVTADDESFTLYPQQGQYKVADNCAASRNYQRPMTAAEVAGKQGETFVWMPTIENGRSYILVNVPGSADAPAYYERDQ